MRNVAGSAKAIALTAALLGVVSHSDAQAQTSALFNDVTGVIYVEEDGRMNGFTNIRGEQNVHPGDLIIVRENPAHKPINDSSHHDRLVFGAVKGCLGDAVVSSPKSAIRLSGVGCIGGGLIGLAEAAYEYPNHLTPPYFFELYRRDEQFFPSDPSAPITIELSPDFTKDLFDPDNERKVKFLSEAEKVANVRISKLSDAQKNYLKEIASRGFMTQQEEVRKANRLAKDAIVAKQAETGQSRKKSEMVVPQTNRNNYRDRLAHIVAVSGVLNIMAPAIFDNPIEAQRFKTAVNHTTAIATALNQLSGPGVDSLVAATATMNIANAAMALGQIFLAGDRGPTVEQAILTSLKQLRDDISALRKEVHQRFDRLEALVNAVYTALESRLKNMDARIVAMHDDVKENQDYLDLINRKVDFIVDLEFFQMRQTLHSKCFRGTAPDHMTLKLSNECLTGFHDGADKVSTVSGLYGAISHQRGHDISWDFKRKSFLALEEGRKLRFVAEELASPDFEWAGDIDRDLTMWEDAARHYATLLHNVPYQGTVPEEIKAEKLYTRHSEDICTMKNDADNFRPLLAKLQTEGLLQLQVAYSNTQRALRDFLTHKKSGVYGELINRDLGILEQTDWMTLVEDIDNGRRFRQVAYKGLIVRKGNEKNQYATHGTPKAYNNLKSDNPFAVEYKERFVEGTIAHFNTQHGAGAAKKEIDRNINRGLDFFNNHKSATDAQIRDSRREKQANYFFYENSRKDYNADVNAIFQAKIKERKARAFIDKMAYYKSLAEWLIGFDIAVLSLDEPTHEKWAKDAERINSWPDSIEAITDRFAVSGDGGKLEDVISKEATKAVGLHPGLALRLRSDSAIPSGALRASIDVIREEIVRHLPADNANCYFSRL